MKIKPVYKVRAILNQNVFFIDYSEQTYQKEKLEKAILWSSDSQLLLPPPPHRDGTGTSKVDPACLQPSDK